MTDTFNAISVTWDNDERTVLRFECKPNWTWADIERAQQRAAKMIDLLPHQKPIATIFMPSSKSLPPNIVSMGSNELLTRHPRVAMLLVVSDKAIIRNLFSTLLQITPQLRAICQFVQTLDEAYSLIERELYRQIAHR